jgi:hypothetical protein
MLQSTDDVFIRKNTDIEISCTITAIDNAKAVTEYSYFKKALFPVSVIVIYEYNCRYYYPLTMEFRLIDNNILYLTEELGITSMEELFKILTSSMNKEEKWSNEFKLAVVHVKTSPKYCFELSKDFNIDNVTQEHIYE